MRPQDVHAASAGRVARGEFPVAEGVNTERRIQLIRLIANEAEPDTFSRSERWIDAVHNFKQVTLSGFPVVEIRKGKFKINRFYYLATGLQVDSVDLKDRRLQTSDSNYPGRGHPCKQEYDALFLGEDSIICRVLNDLNPILKRHKQFQIGDDILEPIAKALTYRQGGKDFQIISREDYMLGFVQRVARFIGY